MSKFIRKGREREGGRKKFATKKQNILNGILGYFNP